MTSQSAADVLSETRGRLMDGLSALRNVQQLLGSVKVSPKSLMEVLPDTAASCERLIGSLARLEQALDSLIDEAGGSTPQTKQTVSEVARLLESHLREISTQVRAVGSNLTAAKRLQLETAFSENARPLATTIGLVELLNEALVGRHSVVDFADLLKDSHGFDQVFAQFGTRRSIHVVLPNESLTARVNARVLVGALAVSAAWILGRQSRQITLELSGAQGNPCMELHPSAEADGADRQVSAPPQSVRQDRVELTIPPWLDVSRQVAELAVQLVGCQLSLSEAPIKATLECSRDDAGEAMPA